MQEIKYLTVTPPFFFLLQYETGKENRLLIYVCPLVSL